MKVKELDFSNYTYERIQAPMEHGVACFPKGGEEALVRLYGERELADGGAAVTDDGWLCLTFAN